MKPKPDGLVLRWGLITVSLSGLLFLSAGTSRIVSLRLYLALFSTWLLFTMLAVDRRLAAERAHPENAGKDDGLRFVTGFLFLLTLSLAALSVGRLPAGLNVPARFRDVALVLFVLSGSLQTWAMIANPFFSPVLRVQVEGEHRVIKNGPYNYMRHPGYLAMLISIPASALAIGSWLALLPAFAFAVVLNRRARIEDEFLRSKLPGYAEYANQVPGRFLPIKKANKGSYVNHSA